MKYSAVTEGKPRLSMSIHTMHAVAYNVDIMYRTTIISYGVNMAIKVRHPWQILWSSNSMHAGVITLIGQKLPFSCTT